MGTMKRTYLITAALAAMLARTTAYAADITPAEARAIAQEAYIYGFPVVDNYRIQHAYWVDRYLINSPTLPQLKRDADGGLTLIIQNESPGKDKEANWLPAPKGPFSMFTRLYWPKQEATEGKWTPPPLKKVE